MEFRYCGYKKVWAPGAPFLGSMGFESTTRLEIIRKNTNTLPAINISEMWYTTLFFLEFDHKYQKQ